MLSLSPVKIKAVLTAMCFLASIVHESYAEGQSRTVSQEQYEWASSTLYTYAQTSSFSLLVLTIPAHTQKAEFVVDVAVNQSDSANTSIVLCLRRKAIPVLHIEAYNQSVPMSFRLPTDQSVYFMHNETRMSLTLSSPKPGYVYLAASILYPLSDVIDFLRWGEGLKNSASITVKATYTLMTTVLSLSTNEVSSVAVQRGQKKTFSFMVPSFTTEFLIIITNCKQNNGTGCPVTMTTADSLAEGDSSAITVDCANHSQQCVVSVISPLVQHDHYVIFTQDDSGSAQNVTFDVEFFLQECNPVADSEKQSNGQTDLLPLNYWNKQMNGGRVARNTFTQSSEPPCVNLGHLGRDASTESVDDSSFGVQFGIWNHQGEIVTEINVVVPDYTVDVRTFTLKDSTDSGGVLFLTAVIADQDRFWHGLVWVCAMPHRLPANDSVDICEGGTLLTINSTNEDVNETSTEQAFLPFPVSGSWYLALKSQCWKESGPVPCGMLPMVELTVGITQCAPDSCGKYGTCEVYIEASRLFAGCRCYAGYRGLACTDNVYSLTEEEQKAAVYLLTLSNLAFLPTICLALYRRHFTLAIIFAFTCFFSTFYHACDTSHVYQKCIMKYETLAFCDFFGSVLSFYAVLLTMARLPETARTFFLMSGTLVIAVFQNDDRHSDLAHILPLVAAGLIMIVSWIRVMWIRKQLFPSGRRYLFCLFPGIALAALGIAINYGFGSHQSTYQYTHSFWHVALMTAPCFLMPPRRRPLKACNSGLSISAQDIIRVGHQPEPPQQVPSADEEEPSMFDASMSSLNNERALLV